MTPAIPDGTTENAAGDARLVIAGRMHARADGATAFFLFHYLRLLEEQDDARRAGSPCPIQTWTMPDWSPAPPAESAIRAAKSVRKPVPPLARHENAPSPSKVEDRMLETSSGSAR
jgi:hypothetical protein